MTVKAPGTNSPLDRRTKKAEQRKKELTAQYVAEGINAEAAEAKAIAEMRDNEKMDWRRG